MISVRPANQTDGHLAGWVSVCGKTFNFVIFSDYIYDNVKLCMMVVLTELYILTTFIILDSISRSQKCETVLTENCMFLSD